MNREKTIDYSSLFETIKQPLRLLIAAVLGWGVSQFSQYVPFLDQVDEKWVWGVASSLVLTLDKVLHDFGKDNKMEKLTKGVTGWVGV